MSALTLPGRVRRRALEEPGRLACIYLADGETEHCRVTVGDLDQRAAALAAVLRGNAAPGEPVLILLPSGPDYLAAVLGCFYAGCAAIPAQPLQPGHAAARLSALAADAGVRVAVTGSGQADDALPQVTRVDVTRLSSAQPASSLAPLPAPEALALVQYTSGSTASPRGVHVTHANLTASLQAYEALFEVCAETVIVSWVPLHHDMGLVGRALLALWLGAPLVLMPPEAFLASPVRWLRAITRYGGVLSGGPDFAFALCAQKIPASERAGLDLKTWRLALNASEPVRAATLQQFAAAYGPCGLPADALRPAYGLAEGVAIVTGGRPAQVQAFDRFALEQGDVHPVSAEAPRTRRLVSCGVPPPGACLLIVDPETRRVAAPNVVGEVWLSGPNVAAGYWRRPAETEEIFRAHLADGAGPFLRTGDLGFVFQDLLYLCGRRKDLILLHGRNCAPEDVEETATASEARLRPGGGAAFTIEVGEAERLVIMHEVRGPLTAEAAAQVIGAIRRAVARQHGLRAYAVSLLAPRALPKTSSGKVQRRACRAAFLAGQLPALAEWRAPPD